MAMPELIEAKRDIDKEVSKKDEVFRLRMTKEEKTQLERLAKSNGFKTISSYIRAKAFINA
ncbi:MAG: hypothetical protein LBC61_01960 [Candidatus Peribacteria bacterium]|nr:hypothetical protein [Candidatus Peribacteria bacterium]